MEKNQKILKPIENSSVAKEIGCLVFAALPIAIYTLAMFIFEQGNFGSIALESKLAAIAHATKDRSALMLFAESRLRMLWLSSVLLYYILAIAAIVKCIRVLHGSLTPKGFKQALGLWAILACVELSHLAYAVGNDTALGTIFRFTFDSLQSSCYFKLTELSHIKTMVSMVNLLAAIAPFSIALAAAANLAPVIVIDPHQNLQRLIERSQQLKSVVNLGSALLVAGVLHMQTWLRWPIVFVDDAKLASAMYDWSLSLTTYIGGVFSLMIACVYICCAKALAKLAVANLQQLPLNSLDTSFDEWLVKHGFSSEPTQIIPQILAIFAPLLAGSVGVALIGLGNPVGH